MKRPALIAIFVVLVIAVLAALTRLRESATSPPADASEADVASSTPAAEPIVSTSTPPPPIEAAVAPRNAAAIEAEANPPPIAPKPPTNDPAAQAATTTTPRTALPSEGLVVGGQIVPGRALTLLDAEFDAFLIELAAEAELDPSARELQQLYREQIAEILADSAVTIRQLQCGRRICAVELHRARDADPADPFASPGAFADLLPRGARIEIAFEDRDGNPLRRFLFSIDPALTSIQSGRKAPRDRRP